MTHYGPTGTYSKRQVEELLGLANPKEVLRACMIPWWRALLVGPTAKARGNDEQH